MERVGVSWFIDLSGVDDPNYHDKNKLIELLTKAVNLGGYEILDRSGHQFKKQLNGDKPGGSTVFLLLTESHISAHTWSEYDQINIDLFSCGPRESGELVIDYLIENIPHDRYRVEKIVRGEDD